MTKRNYAAEMERLRTVVEQAEQELQEWKVHPALKENHSNVVYTNTASNSTDFIVPTELKAEQSQSKWSFQKLIDYFNKKSVLTWYDYAFQEFKISFQEANREHLLKENSQVQHIGLNWQAFKPLFLLNASLSFVWLLMHIVRGNPIIDIVFIQFLLTVCLFLINFIMALSLYNGDYHRFIHYQPYNSHLYINREKIEYQYNDKQSIFIVGCQWLSVIIPLFPLYWEYRTKKAHRQQFTQWANSHFTATEQAFLMENVELNVGNQTQHFVIGDKTVDVVPIKLEQQYHEYIQVIKETLLQMIRQNIIYIDEDELSRSLFELYYQDLNGIQNIRQLMLDLKAIRFANPHIVFHEFVRDSNMHLWEQLAQYKTQCNQLVLETVKPLIKNEENPVPIPIQMRKVMEIYQ